MKKLICIALLLIVGNAIAATKCENDGRGNVCCWDTNKDGPFKPISCW